MTDEYNEPSGEARGLARSTARLSNALTGLDTESLARRPSPNEWNAWDVAYHVAQMEVWYFAKLCEATSDDPAEAMRRFLNAWRQLRIEGIALAGGIPPEGLDRAGVLSGVPDWTPRQLLERIAAHDREHAAQVEAAVASRPPTDPAPA
jgi:hypothetical protein